VWYIIFESCGKGLVPDLKGRCSVTDVINLSAQAGRFFFGLKREVTMNRRLGFVGIIIEDRVKSAPDVNRILSEYGDLIVARTGLPHAHGKMSVITLVVDTDTDSLGVLTGRLGSLEGISVKSMLAKTPAEKKEERI